LSATAVDRLLALVVAVQLATGLVTLRAGAPATAPLFVAHGLLGGTLALLVMLKLRRSVPRAIRGRRVMQLGLAMVVAALTAAALVGGFAWVASGRILSLGSWTVLTLHAWAALALVPLLALHLFPRRWRLLIPTTTGPARAATTSSVDAWRQLSRRRLLQVALLSGAGLVAWLTANASEALLGGRRRFTGSRALPSGGIPPVTTFYGEPTPTIGRSWRLKVSGRVLRELSLTLAGIAATPHVSLEATLDCTSGWALTTTWSGVSLSSMLASAGILPDARSITIRSVTGWATTMTPAEAQTALLATHVAGQALPRDNGAPLRLVAPARRGLDWVKWVDRVEVA
jgi:molybdopterin-dependent oxidoreductase-like protein protein